MSTTSANMPNTPTKMQGKPDGMHGGYPYFKANDDMFWNLHLKKREKKQWFKTHYKDSNVAQWAKQNKGRDFYLYHPDNQMFRKIKAQ